MSLRPNTNVGRFVRSAWALLAFQFIASAAAAALAFWAVIEVRHLVEERDALVAQVAALEAARRGPPTAAPVLLPEELQAAAPPPASSVVTRDDTTRDPIPPARPDTMRPPDATPREQPSDARPPGENVVAPIARPEEPKPQDVAPRSETSRR